jgi:hypothetical protein
MRTPARAALALALVMAASPAGATILTFEGMGVDRREPVPATYGDNVDPACTDDGCCDDHGCYTMGNAFTPNITVEYATLKTTGQVLFDYLKYWEMDRYGNTYGDLDHVAYAVQDGKIAEISLVPEPGYRVVLNGFDLAGWDLRDVEHQMVRIVDGRGSVLLDLSDVHVAGGQLVTADATSNNGPSGSGSSDLILVGSHTPIRFDPPLVSSETIRIRFGTSIGVAVDNVDFDQQQATVNPSGDQCEEDLACQAGLNQVTSKLLACEAALASHDEEMAVLEEALASQQAEYEAEIARLEADADGDGVRNLDDACAGTPADMAVDGNGCSQAQFCAKVNAATRIGRRLCPRVDWMNDEPVMLTKGRDCTIDRGGPGTADDRCVVP